MYQCWWRAFWTSLVRKSFMWYAGTYFFFCIYHLLMYYEESEKMDSNMEIKRFRTHVHITLFRLLSVRNVSWSLCCTFCYTCRIYYIKYMLRSKSNYTKYNQLYRFLLQTSRFLTQVLTDKVALTGQNFFPVTRTALLTVSKGAPYYWS